MNKKNAKIESKSEQHNLFNLNSKIIFNLNQVNL